MGPNRDFLDRYRDFGTATQLTLPRLVVSGTHLVIRRDPCRFAIQRGEPARSTRLHHAKHGTNPSFPRVLATAKTI